MSGQPVRAHRFRANLRGTAAEIRRKATLIVNGITFAVYAEILSDPDHPVDTGRLRSGWSISVYVVGDHKPAAGEGSYQPQPAETFVATLEAAPLQAKRFIYNHVEYAVWVFGGSEGRAGSHTPELAIARVIQKGTKAA
jgi:hypothetical protein